MQDEREVVAAIIVTLSKVHQLTKGNKGISEETLENLKDLERAVTILSTLCGDSEAELEDWKGRIEGLRKEIERTSQEIQGRMREYQNLLQRDVMAVLGRRLPEGEFREKVEEELNRILGKDSVIPVEASRTSSGDTKISSALELKLERIESDMEDRGLEKYLRKRGEDSRSSEG